jgi:hypothetical protein
MGIMRSGHSNGRAEPIEISPAPALYLVEFTLGRQRNERISIILPATCGLAAMAAAWTLFPEYKRDALRVSVHRVRYVEVDWQTGRTLVVKQERQPYILTSGIEELNKRSRRTKRNEEEAQ